MQPNLIHFLCLHKSDLLIVTQQLSSLLIHSYNPTGPLHTSVHTSSVAGNVPFHNFTLLVQK